ncbi:MAG: hypothetical protein EZS28_014621, partial [Streblomastix strix]
GTTSSPAQLLAESSSFSEAGVENKNKWVLADRDTCKITGSLGQENILLFAPQIQSIKATGNTDKTGIDVVIEGKSLFKCSKLNLQVSSVSQQTMNADAVKQYKLADVATSWDDTQVSAFIKADEVVKRGLTLVVSVLVQTADNSLQDAETTSGGSNTVVVRGFEAEKESEKGETATGIGKLIKTLMTIGLVILIVSLVVFVVVALVTVGCIIYRRKHSSSSETRLGGESVENRE